jgi:hypothetical protein
MELAAAHHGVAEVCLVLQGVPYVTVERTNFQLKLKLSMNCIIT